MNKKAILEGLLFVVGDDGLTMDQIKDILEIDSDEAKELISELQKDYEEPTRGIRIGFLGNTFKLKKKKEHKPYYQKLIENPESNVLSNAALETLAIIAYNAPITRLKVDEIRGVSSSQMMKKLLAKGLIKELGRSDQPGRPILYGTTSEFLDFFGLSTIDDLPPIEQFTKQEETDEDDETDLYHSKYTEMEQNQPKPVKIPDEIETL